MNHFYERAPTHGQILEESHALDKYRDSILKRMWTLNKRSKEYRDLNREAEQIYAAKIALLWASGVIIKTPLRCFETGTTKLEDE